MNVSAKATSSARDATIAWKAVDIDGIGSVTLRIDGTRVDISNTSSGSTWGTYLYSGSLSAGKHTYVISVIGSAGASKTYRNTLTVTAPPIPTFAARSALQASRIANAIWTTETDWRFDSVARNF